MKRIKRLLIIVLIVALIFSLGRCSGGSRGVKAKKPLEISDAKSPAKEIPAKPVATEEPKPSEEAAPEDAPEEPEPTEEAIPESPPPEVTEEPDMQEQSDGIRPEFKRAMDGYEEFFRDYCDFMKSLDTAGGDLKAMLKYAEMMANYEKYMSDFAAIDESELNEAELIYYIEVNARIQQMLVEAAY